MLFSAAELASASGNPFSAFLFILRNGGLVVFFPILVWMGWEMWMYWIQNLYSAKKRYVLLAIDVPRDNEQSMRAVEHIMTALHGVHFNPNNKEKYWLGVSQDKFALEIVSIDGYIQYFMWCDHYNADLVKAAVYAQYPDAEIVEVEDYVPNVPYKYPDEQIDMWGTEFVLAKNDVYPIRTYEQFEHSLLGVFADPMAAILEVMSRLRPGEQVWLQWVITPEGIEWRNKGIKEVYKLIGKTIPGGRNLLDVVLDVPIKFLGMIHDGLFGPFAPTDEEQNINQGNFLNLTTGEKLIVEEIQKKIARIVWHTKFRFLYFGSKKVFDKYRVVGSIFGAIKQFNTLDLNAFRAGGKTIVSKPTYFFVDRRRNNRRNRLMMAYKARSNWAGEGPGILSDVEVATIFHFPSIIVRAPLISKTEAKKAEPPSRLPVEGGSPFTELREVPSALEPPTAQMTTAPTESTPVAVPGHLVHSMPGLPPGVRAAAYHPYRHTPSPHAHSPFPIPYSPTHPPVEHSSVAKKMPVVLSKSSQESPTHSAAVSSTPVKHSSPSDVTVQKASPPSNLPFA